MENLHTLQHQQQQDRSMGNFFDTPDPAKTTAPPPPFAPTAQPARMDGSFMPYYSSSLANSFNQGGPQKQQTSLTPTHPGQGQQKAPTEVPKSTQPVRITGAGVGLKAPNKREDVIATMQTLSQLGYAPSVQEYQMVLQSPPNQPIPSEKLNSFVAQITAFQKQNMKIGGGYGNIQSGGITHDTLNKALAKAQTQQKTAKQHQGIPLTSANQATETENAGNPLYSPDLNQALSYNQTPAAPPTQAGILTNSAPLTLTHGAVGDKAKNHKEDVLRTMEALAYAGYKTDYCEYEAVQKHEPADQPIPLDQLPNFISQIHRFQKDQKMGSDGNITQGKDTMKKLNAAIAKKAAADPALVKKREEEEAAKREAKADEAIAKNKGPEGDKALVNELLQGFKSDFAYFDNLLCKINEQTAKDETATPTPKLLRQMMMRLLADDWFTNNSKKDPDFKAKVVFLRKQFINAAQANQQNQEAPQYTPEFLYLDNQDVAPDKIFESYGEIEENAAVEVIKKYMPTLALLKKQSGQLGADGIPTPASLSSEKTYKGMLQEMGKSQVLFAAFYSPQLAIYQKEGYKEVMDDMMPYVAVNGAPVQNGYRKEMEMNLLTLLSKEDELTRDYILNRMNQKGIGQQKSQLSNIQAGNATTIKSQFGDEGAAHLTQVQSLGTKEGLQQEWEQNPAILLEQYPDPKTLAPKLVELLTKQPQMYHKVRSRIIPENAGRTAFRFFMQAAEGGKAASIPSGVYCDMIEDIESGRETWWTDLEKKTYPNTLTQMQAISGLQGQKGNHVKEINQKGTEAAKDPYWLHEKMNGEPQRIADHIGTKLPADTKAFDSLLQGQGQLNGPEYEKDLFHRIIISAMTDERIWEWDRERIKEIGLRAKKYGLNQLVGALVTISERKGEMEIEKSEDAYCQIETALSNTQEKINEAELEKEALLAELRILDPENPMLYEATKGKHTFISEGTYDQTKTVHHPTGTSGVTIGQGYDMKYKEAEKVRAEMLKIGVSPSMAAEIAKGAKKTGDEAKKFMNDFKKANPNFSLSPEQVRALFKISYEEEEGAAIHRFTKYSETFHNPADRENILTKEEYEALPNVIKEFLTDLKFRGDLMKGERYKISEVLVILKKGGSKTEMVEQFKVMVNEKIKANDMVQRQKRRLAILNEEDFDLKAQWLGTVTAKPASGNEEKETPTENAQFPGPEELEQQPEGIELSCEEYEELQAQQEAQKAARIEEIKKALPIADQTIANENCELDSLTEMKGEMDAQIRHQNLKITDTYMGSGTQMIEAYRTGDTLDIPALTTELAETTLFAQGMVSNIHSQLKTKEEQEQFLDQLTAQWETQGLLPHLTPELRDTVLALTGNCPPAHERMTRPDTAGTPAKTREDLDKGLGRNFGDLDGDVFPKGFSLYLAHGVFFEPRWNNRTSAYLPHGGTDMNFDEMQNKNKSGETPISPVLKGTITYAKNVLEPKPEKDNGFGGQVLIYHGRFNDRDLYTNYGHMDINSVNPKYPREVSHSEIIGKMGNTGHSSGAHLHYDVYLYPRSENPLKRTTVSLDYEIDPFTLPLILKGNFEPNEDDFAGYYVNLFSQYPQGTKIPYSKIQPICERYEIYFKNEGVSDPKAHLKNILKMVDFNQ